MVQITLLLIIQVYKLENKNKIICIPGQEQKINIFFPPYSRFGLHGIRRFTGISKFLFKNIINLNGTHPVKGLVTNFQIELDLMNASQTF